MTTKQPITKKLWRVRLDVRGAPADEDIWQVK